LYAHPPGDAREQARQDEYARWIAREPGGVRVVCSMLAAATVFARAWRVLADGLLGCDPSRDNGAGFGNGLRLWTGSASNLPDDVRADLVIAVNVIEHTVDPIAFLTALRVLGQTGSS
jgi:hypothetical protein